MKRAGLAGVGEQGSDLAASPGASSLAFDGPIRIHYCSDQIAGHRRRITRSSTMSGAPSSRYQHLYARLEPGIGELRF
jgi:hypothetical protein